MVITNFTVATVPVAQPRARFSSAGGRVKAYTPGCKIKVFKAAIVSAAEQDLLRRFGKTYSPATGPIAVDLEFYMPMTKLESSRKGKAKSKWHSKKPDIDNLAKAVMDSLNKVVWADDSQVCRLTCAKVIHGSGEEPGVVVRVTHLGEDAW